MTKILIHELPVATRGLADWLRTVLRGIGGDEALRLAERLDQLDRRAPRLVLTGQFSSGKSMLINALTDGAAKAETGVDATTDHVREYPWGHEVVIVDTPGVQSDRPEHDERAEDAIAGADLVLFVLTPDLLDDAGESHLRHVAVELAKFDQMLVVITMKNTMPADRGVRQEAVDRVLDDGRSFNVVECDAKDYLLGGAFVGVSGIDELRAAINRLTEVSGQLAVDRQPLQLIATTATEALPLVSTDRQEVRDLLRLLGDRRLALTSTMARIESVLADLRVQFVSKAGEAAEEYADKLDELDQPELQEATRSAELDAAEKWLEARLTTFDEWFVSQTEQTLDTKFADLQRAVDQIEQSPHARMVEEFSAPTVYKDDIRRGSLPPHRRLKAKKPPSPQMPDFIGKVPEWSARFVEQWGAGTGRTLRDSAGTRGHIVIRGAASKLGIRLKPWQAVKTADKVGRIAKGAAAISVVINVLDGGKEVFDEIAQLRAERERQKRRRTVVNGITAEASRIATELHDDVQAQIRTQFEPSINQIDELTAEVLNAQASRTGHSIDLERIANEARALLEATAPASRRTDHHSS